MSYVGPETTWSDIHDPNDVEWKGFYVSTAWVQNDPINTVVFTAPEDSGLTIAEPIVETAHSEGVLVKALISGGVKGVWPIETRVTTVAGRIREKTIHLKVREQ